MASNPTAWFFGSQDRKDVEALLVHSISYQNERRNRYMSDAEMLSEAQARAPKLCREDLLRAQIREILTEGGAIDGNLLAVKIYLTAPLAKNRLPAVHAIGLKFLDSFGIVHMGLQIGRMRLDWMSDSFVHMKLKGAEQGEAFARVVLDPASSGSFVRVSPEMVTSLARVVSEWNREKLYHMMIANCQDFIHAVLKVLDICFTPPTGAFASYLETLKLHPEKANIHFLPRRGGNSVLFNSHEELDAFHRRCQQQSDRPNEPHNPNQPRLYVLDAQDEALLKAFHRAFQFKESLSIQKRCMLGEPTIYPKTDTCSKKKY